MEDQIIIRKKRELGEILQDSFTFLKSNLKDFYKPILIIALIWSAVFSISIVSGLISVESVIGKSESGPLSVFTVSYFSSVGLSAFVSGFGSLAIFIILFNFIKYKIDNPNSIPTNEDLFQNFWDQFFRIFIYSIPLAILNALLFCLFIVPGIWFSVIFIFMLTVLFFELNPFGESLKRTRELVKDHWWNSFLALIVPSLIISIIIAIISSIVIGGIVAAALLNQKAISETVNSLSSGSAFSKLSIPIAIFYFIVVMIKAFTSLWICTCIAFQYFNLVERKDNLALKSELDSLGTTPAIPPTSPESY